MGRTARLGARLGDVWLGEAETNCYDSGGVYDVLAVRCPLDAAVSVENPSSRRRWFS